MYMYPFGLSTKKTVIIATKKCPYWMCKKQNGNYFVHETGQMRPIFDKDSGHLISLQSGI